MDIKRLWIIGDLHAGVHSNSNEWFGNMAFYFDKMLIPMLKTQSKEGDILCFTGDINDNNQIVRTEIANYLIDTFTKLGEILPVHIIIGNHDIVKKYTNEVNSVRPLGMIDNVTVYTKPKELDLIDGTKLLMLPWCHTVEAEAEEIDKTEASFMLSHAHYMGMAFSDEYVYKDKGGTIISNPLKILNKFTRVWNGHIHKPELFGGVRNVGIPYPMKWTDYGYECGLVLYDVESKKEQFIKNKASSDFVYFQLITMLDMDTDVVNEKIKNNYVKVMFPSEMRKLLDLEVLYNHLEGYRSLEFVPTTERIKDNSIFEQIEEFNTNKNLDVENVIPHYADSIPEDEDTKDRLRKDLQRLYKLTNTNNANQQADF